MDSCLARRGSIFAINTVNTARKPPTVALVNPLWIGHHPMYFSQFTAAFVRAGARVIGLCPQPAAALRDALETITDKPEDIGSVLQMRQLQSGRRSWFGMRYEGDPLTTLGRWRRSATALRTAERATGWSSDLVFFPHVDSYLRFLPLPAVPRLLLGKPWSGLYLRNHHHADPADSMKTRLRLLAKGDALFRSHLCLGIGVLDERFNDSLAAYTGKPVTSYPDATLTGLPDTPDPFAAGIVTKARGRKIIGLIGLERRKGLLTMLKVAEQTRRLKLPWYFVCAGNWIPELFEQQERQALESIARKAASGEIDNLHFDPRAGRIPTEAAFNALFSRFDVAWVAYEGFQGSSGALSKAAAFGIPVVATAGECVGDRVEAFRLGLTIPEGDSSRAIEAIRRLLLQVDWQDQPLCPGYDEFRQQHGVARLDRLVADLLQSLGQTVKPAP